MRITITSGRQKQKPKVGDKKIIKGVEHVRVLRIIDHPLYGRCVDYSNGRYHYDWKPVVEMRDTNKR